uniref:hypothetical protein n=1 Tax=Paenibacillus alginolyticus TaxID=59839 RepID=UPI001C3F9BE2
LQLRGPFQTSRATLAPFDSPRQPFLPSQAAKRANSPFTKQLKGPFQTSLTTLAPFEPPRQPFSAFSGRKRLKSAFSTSHCG